MTSRSMAQTRRASVCPAYGATILPAITWERDSLALQWECQGKGKEFCNMCQKTESIDESDAQRMIVKYGTNSGYRAGLKAWRGPGLPYAIIEVNPFG